MTWAAVAVPGGGYRIYGNVAEPGGEPSASAFSEDGKAWTLEPGRRIERAAPDVGVAVYGTGRWVTAHLALIP